MHVEDSALARGAFHPDRAAVLHSDPLADRQSQTCTLALGGKEWREEPGEMLGRDPRSIVGEVDHEEPALPR